MMVYAKFQYSVNALFCEPTEICEYKRKLYMYVPEFRTMLTSTNFGPLKRSADLAYWVRIPPASEFFIPQTVLQCTQNFINVLIICIFYLTFLEPLIHDSEYGHKRYNNNAICLLVSLNKRAKLILPNLLVDWSNLTVIGSAYLLPPWHFIWTNLYVWGLPFSGTRLFNFRRCRR